MHDTFRQLISYMGTPWNVCAVRDFVMRGVGRKFGGSGYFCWQNYDNQAVKNYDNQAGFSGVFCTDKHMSIYE